MYIYWRVYVLFVGGGQVGLGELVVRGVRNVVVRVDEEALERRLVVHLWAALIV